LLPHLHDRNRSLRRDARNPPPDKFVKHHVGDNEQPPLPGRLKKML